MKYYAVKEGRTPGVYTTWSECEAQVKGYPGADYKKFNNEEDARLFVYGVCETITTMNQMEFKSYEPEVQYIKLNTITVTPTAISSPLIFYYIKYYIIPLSLTAS